MHTGDHKLILIQFELTPERYQISQCEDHPNHLLDEICKHCDHMFCNRCVVKNTQCTTGMMAKSRVHVFERTQTEYFIQACRSYHTVVQMKVTLYIYGVISLCTFVAELD